MAASDNVIVPLSGPVKEFRLLPAGEFRACDGRPEDVESWRLDADAAEALVSAAASRSEDYLIDYEHQSLRSMANGQPVPAAGWFKRLEWREGDGLYVVDARWTPAAAKMLTSREYRYVSPVFSYGKDGQVNRIVSAALTNTPALEGLTDLAAASLLPGATSGNHLSAEDYATLRHVFGDGVVFTSSTPSAEACSRERGGRMSSSELEETNAKLEGIFGPGATKAG